MKKFLVVIGILFLLTGCNKKQKLDFNKLENALLNSSYYSNHEVLDNDIVSNRYSLNVEIMSDILFISSKSYNDATMALVVSPNNNDVKKEIEKLIKSYNDQWVSMNYFPEQKELVENALSTTFGDYIIYIVSKDNSEVLKLIKE